MMTHIHSFGPVQLLTNNMLLLCRDDLFKWLATMREWDQDQPGRVQDIVRNAQNFAAMAISPRAK